jgi:hypothetical protein
MSLPRVSVLYSNGNLLADISVIDGIAGIVGTVNTPGLIGVPKIYYSLAEAVTDGFTEADEPFMYRQLKEFYDEVAGNQEVHVMGIADTMSMAEALDYLDADGAMKLRNAANGKIRLLGVCRKPDGGYDPGNGFFDSDVEAASAKAKTFCQNALTALVPLRVLIEGRVTDDTSGDMLAPNTLDNGFMGVVVGGSANDGSASVGTALGRAVKYAAHIKVGKVANGPLSIATIYIGTKLLKDYSGLETLHDSGVISFMQHPNKAGFYFGIDHMASTDDYRLLAYGRVVDKTAIIAAAVYMEELEDEVKVDANGYIDELEIEHLKGVLTQQVNKNMADQISGLQVLIDPKQDITSTSKLTVKVRVQPLGYKSFIDVDLGLNAPSA